MARIQIKVVGMSCEHCVKRVKQALSSLPGIKAVEVDLKTGLTSFEKTEEISFEEISRAIREAGYQVEEK